MKKKTRKRKKSRLLEATQNKKLKQELPLPPPALIVPAKSSEFWKWVTQSASATPEPSLALLADMVAKPVDLGERRNTVTRAQMKNSGNSYYSRLNAIKMKDDSKVPHDTSKLEAGIHERLNQGKNSFNNSKNYIYKKPD